MFVNRKMYPTSTKLELKFHSNTVKLWNKTGGEAHTKQATFQVLFTRLHPGTHLTRINCHWSYGHWLANYPQIQYVLHELHDGFQSKSLSASTRRSRSASTRRSRLNSSIWHQVNDYTRFGSSVSKGRLRISLVCCCNIFEVSTLQECDSPSLGNWFPTFRDDEGFESPRNSHNDPRRRDKYVRRRVPRDAASRSRRTETSRAPLRIFYLFVIISDQSNWCLGADLHILTALYTQFNNRL